MLRKTVFLLLVGFFATTMAIPLLEAMVMPVKVVVVVMFAAMVQPEAPVEKWDGGREGGGGRGGDE